MISTYDRTTFHPNLEEATIEVVVTEKIKYADEKVMRNLIPTRLEPFTTSK